MKMKVGIIFMKSKSGCCNNIGGGPDISLVTLPSFDLMDGLGIWMVGLAVVISPFIRPAVWRLDCQTGILKTASQTLGIKKQTLLTCSCLMYSLVTFTSYHRILQTQPYSFSLQNNQVLAMGYFLLLTALGLKATCASYHLWTPVTAKGRQSSKPCAGDVDSKNTSQKNEDNGVCERRETIPCVLALVGHSLIMARMAGLIVCNLLILSCIATSLFERYVRHHKHLQYKMDTTWKSEESHIDAKKKVS